MAMQASSETKSTKQLNQEKSTNVFLKNKEITKPVVEAVEVCQKNENNGIKQVEGTGESETMSYRVVIALKNPAHLLNISNNLLREDDLKKARLIILEFALTTKNQAPKKIFTAAIKGALKDVANGDVWPERGPLSFKYTLYKMHLKMQIMREKEKRTYLLETMFEDNNEMRKKCEGLETEVKGLKEEIQCLKLRMTKAKSFL